MGLADRQLEQFLGRLLRQVVAGVGLVARDRLGGAQLQPEFLGDRAEVAAAVGLLQCFLDLLVGELASLLGLPCVDDLGLDLGQGRDARRRDAVGADHEVLALRRFEQLALAALARGEGGLHQLRRRRADDDLLARRILAAGIDALDGPDLEIELLGGGDHRLGLAERAFEVGDQLDQQVGRELRLELGLDLFLDLLERRHLAGLDAVDAHDVPAERRLDRLGGDALWCREHAVGEGAGRQVLLQHRAELDHAVGIAQHFLGGVLERLAGLGGLDDLFGLVLAVCHRLVDVALFRRAELGRAGVVFLLHLLRRDGDLPHHVVDRHQDIGEGTVLGNLELGLVGFEISAELLGGRLGHVDDDGVGDIDGLADPPLALHLEDVVAEAGWREALGADRAEQLRRGDLAADVGDVGSLRDARLLQQGAVLRRIERAARALESRIAGNRGLDLAVAHDQPVLLHGVVDHRALHHVLERADVQAITHGLFRLGPLPGLTLDLLDLPVEAVADLLDGDRGAAQPAVKRDVRAADMSDFGAAPADLEHVADAPQREADDQHRHEGAHDEVGGQFSEFVHGRLRGGGGGGTTGRMPTTGPPCRQRGSPLDTLAYKYEEIMARTRRPLIAGNWKMNGLKADAMALARGVADGVKQAGWTDREVLVCPPATLVLTIADAVRGTGLVVGGQDCHAKASGAHTGETSAEMLRDAGASHVIVGHSERRTDCGETDAIVRAKAEAAWRAGLLPIVCIGETLAEREAGRTLAVLETQLKGSVPAGATAATLVVAYEPVWAIGTGKTPTTPEVAAAHAHIRKMLGGLVADAAGVRLLYGGSVKGSNAAELLAAGDVDGALVGGASLKADEFLAIAKAA